MLSLGLTEGAINLTTFTPIAFNATASLSAALLEAAHPNTGALLIWVKCFTIKAAVYVFPVPGGPCIRDIF